MSEVVVQENPKSDSNPIDLLNQVQITIDILKEIIRQSKEQKKKKEKKEPSEKKEKGEKLPKYVYMKDGQWFKKDVSGSEKIELKKYILEKMLF